jgi:alpha-beta hydrolase superfamily lysophospholipase
MPRLDGRFAGTGGPEIYWQSWQPVRPATASLVVAHGAAEHSGRYAPLAEHLVAHGIAVYALDHRGHGRSDGSGALVDLAAGDGPRPYLLGHSMGACLALELALADQTRLAGLVLSSPLVALDTPRPLLALSRVLSAVVPRLGVYGVEAAQVSHDPEQVRRYDEDPLNYRGRLPVRTIAEMSKGIARFPARAPGLELPLLILQGAADRIVPPAGAEALAERAGSQDKTLKVYPGLYHELFNEAEPDRSMVLGELVGWLRTPRP